MIILGIILILLAVLAGYLLFTGIDAVQGNITVNVLGSDISLPPVTLVVVGMVVITAFWLGWVLFRTGIKRSHRRRAAAKAKAKEAKAEREAADREAKHAIDVREEALKAEREEHEAERARIAKEADERIAEQHRSTELARKRAEAAEQQLDPPGDA